MVDIIWKVGAGEKSIIKDLDPYVFTLARYISKKDLKYLKGNVSLCAFNLLKLQKFEMILKLSISISGVKRQHK